MPKHKPVSPILYIVVPCFNESACLPETTKRLRTKLSALVSQGTISPASRIVYVDDGSKDDTWSMIEDFEDIVGLKLSRNRGHQNALLAGLMFAKEHCDLSISMDADLQDDINAIDEMLARAAKGYEVVYGVRNSRATDSWFKRTTAQGFYKIMHWLGVEVTYNSADYRLLSCRALEALSEYREVNLFLRGVVPLIGYRSATVEYARTERFAGESKYPLKKMLAFAWEGITSLTIRPIQMILALGVIVFIVSLVVLIYALIRKLLGQVVDGWTFIIFSIWILGGLQMISLGIVGEYIGKIYAEVKHRPKYFIETISGPVSSNTKTES